MTRPFRVLAWSAATATYLLIVVGAIVRITGSGMGCGDHWPLCNGHLFPPLDDIATVIEWTHRLLAAVVSVPVVALAVYTWWLRKTPSADRRPPSVAAYWALALLIPQALLGAITVKLELPHWTVVLHFMMALTMFAFLLAAAVGGWRMADGVARKPDRSARAALVLGFVVIFMGAMTAKLGAGPACTGFPLCNGELWPSTGGLAHVHWIHRLLAYALVLHVGGWAIRSGRRTADSGWRMAPWLILGLVTLQVVVAIVMVSSGFPPRLQALHVAVGAALWAGLVLVNAAVAAGAPRLEGESPKQRAPA
jgi:heme A synthase